MEQRGIVLSAIAKVLNAGGSALVGAYDALASLKTGAVTGGERGSLKARHRECERKLGRLYFEIGKDVAQREPEAQKSEAIEAGIKLAAEYRAEMEKIRRRLQEVEGEQRAKETALARAGNRAEPAAGTRGPAEVEAAGGGEVPAGTVEEKTQEVMVTVAEMHAPQIDTDAGETTEPAAAEVSAGIATDEMTGVSAEAAETPAAGAAAAGATTEALGSLLKDDLLKLCLGKGIEADKRMTKAEIILLLQEGGGHETLT